MFSPAIPTIPSYINIKAHRLEQVFNDGKTDFDEKYKSTINESPKAVIRGPRRIPSERFGTRKATAGLLKLFPLSLEIQKEISSPDPNTT